MIRLHEERCRGCRACEMACSFHHSGRKAFSPTRSSTKVARDNDTGVITVSMDATCDLCAGEEQPLCVRYCAYGAREAVRR